MTTTDEALTERLWDALNGHRPRLTDTEMHAGGAVDRVVLGRIGDVADALAPIIRKAQADALRRAAQELDDYADSPTPKLDGAVSRWLRARADIQEAI